MKELYLILKSLVTILLFSLKNGNADITISVAEPEKYLYLLWLPFLRVTYILHSEPKSRMTGFTTFTCNHCLGKKKRIVTVSAAMKRSINTSWQIEPAKQIFVQVIYNCIAEADSIVTAGRVNNEKLLITTMGHVDKRKNPETWLEVAGIINASRDDTMFLWLGNGPLLDYFKETAGPRILFPGMVGEVAPYLRKTAVYYQPSTTEPHGIAVLEAMYNGLPCVVANTGGLPESVKDGYNGIVVDPLNITENVSALTRLLDDVTLRRSFGANSIERYRQVFSYEHFRKEMDKIYCG